MTATLAGRVVGRNLRVARAWWPVYIGRMLEPFIYLFSVGVGVGALVETVMGPGGEAIPYRTFVAPAMLVGGAMNTAVFSSAIDFYAQYKWFKTFDAMLATPIGVADIMWGELGWILLNIGGQSAAFTVTMVAMGLVESWWAVLLVPTALLVAFAFAALGFVASTLLRSWLDFDFVFLIIIPLFLFSASFFPLDEYPTAVALVVQCTPLYHGVDLARDLTLGTVNGWSIASALYLLTIGVTGIRFATRRIAGMLQP